MAKYNLLHAAAFKIRGLAMAPGLVFIALFPWLEWENDLLVFSIGIPTFCLGLLIRIWAQMHLRYRIEGERSLATTGPYAWIRNPVYIGNIIMLAALCVLCELPWMILPACLWAFLIYHLSVQFEETRLSKRFGDAYDEFYRTTPRWIPGTSSREVAQPMIKAGLRQAFAAEWHCLFLLLIPIAKEAFDVYLFPLFL